MGDRDGGMIRAEGSGYSMEIQRNLELNGVC